MVIITSYFNFALPKNNSPNKLNIEPKKRLSPFENIFEVYRIINESKLEEYENKLDELFKELTISDFTFLVWILNHYFVFNSFTRENIDIFQSVSVFLGNKEYIYFFVKYMITNNIKFPKYMTWYKMGIDNEEKKYKENLKEEFKLNDTEIDEILVFLNNKNISIRDICLCAECLK